MVIALLLGLSVGLGSSSVSFRLRATPYCQVANNAESYNGETVRVRGRLIFSNGGMYIHEECDSVEALISLIEFENDTSARFVLFSDSLRQAGYNPQKRVADAIVEGRFDAYNSPGCYAPKFRIDARKIELLSDVKDYVPPSE